MQCASGCIARSCLAERAAPARSVAAAKDDKDDKRRAPALDSKPGRCRGFCTFSASSGCLSGFGINSGRNRRHLFSDHVPEDHVPEGAGFERRADERRADGQCGCVATINAGGGGVGARGSDSGAFRFLFFLPPLCQKGTHNDLFR